MKSDTKIKKSKRVSQTLYEGDLIQYPVLESESKETFKYESQTVKKEPVTENQQQIKEVITQDQIQIKEVNTQDQVKIKKVSETNIIQEVNYPQNLIEKKLAGPKYQTNKLEPDLFDDNGNVKLIRDEKEEDVKKAILSIKAMISEYSLIITRIIDYKILAPTTRVTKKITDKVATPFIFATHKVVTSFGKIIKKKNIQEVKEEIKEEKPIKYLTANFEKVRALNISFMDNYSKLMYVQNTNNQPLSKLQEELIFNISIDAIKMCADFMKKIPPAKEGRYKDIPMYDLMKAVTVEEIEVFLGYVSKKPKKYACNKWKISETYATWLMNNAPIIEVKD